MSIFSDIDHYKEFYGFIFDVLFPSIYLLILQLSSHITSCGKFPLTSPKATKPLIRGCLSSLYMFFIVLTEVHIIYLSNLAVTDENKSTKTWSAWGGKVVDLSKEKSQEPFPHWAFIGFNFHRNTGKAHQSLSGSKDQTTDNIQRTLRAYSESGSVS